MIAALHNTVAANQYLRCISRILPQRWFRTFFSALLCGADNNEHYILSALAVSQRNYVPGHR